MPVVNQLMYLGTSVCGRWLWIAKTQRGLCRLELGKKTKEQFLISISRSFPGFTVEEADEEKFVAYLDQLEQYFTGKPLALDLPVDLVGTDFQISVWRTLREIPYGQTATYAEIARAVGRPKAFRAVGGACHCNPVLLFVPCHRVIGSNGSLVGFGEGLDLKKELLALERKAWRERSTLKC